MTQKVHWFIAGCFFEDLYNIEESNVEKIENLPNALACQRQCSTKPECTYWSWTHPDNVHEKKSCWLKDGTFSIKRPYAAVTSGPKACLQECFLLGVDTTENAIFAADPSWAPNPMECQKQCTELKGCLTWSYVTEAHDWKKGRGLCFLKSNGLEDFMYAGSAVISGPATC